MGIENNAYPRFVCLVGFWFFSVALTLAVLPPPPPPAPQAAADRARAGGGRAGVPAAPRTQDPGAGHWLRNFSPLTPC